MENENTICAPYITLASVDIHPHGMDWTRRSTRTMYSLRQLDLWHFNAFNKRHSRLCKLRAWISPCKPIRLYRISCSLATHGYRVNLRRAYDQCPSTCLLGSKWGRESCDKEIEIIVNWRTWDFRSSLRGWGKYLVHLLAWANPIPALVIQSDASCPIQDF